MRYRIEWRIHPESRKGWNIVDCRSGKEIGRPFECDDMVHCRAKVVNLQNSYERLHIVASHGRRIEEQ